MATMTAKKRQQHRTDWRSDWWLWPSALLLALGGGGQATWMWENTRPEGLAPLLLLVWTGIAVAGLSLPVFWFARRWWPPAALAMTAWAVVPAVSESASRHVQPVGMMEEWLYIFSPLIVLLLLGLGLSGLIAGMSWYAGRQWSDSSPRVRPLRQGFWSGLFAVICGWLLIVRIFSWILVALLAGALVFIEAYLVVRESPRIT